MNLIFLYMCLLWSVTVAKHGKDDSVCTPPQTSNTGPPRPQFPPIYTVNTECNFLDKKYTAEAQEWYNAPSMLAKVMYVRDGLTTFNLFDYGTNEVLSTNLTAGPNPPPCAAMDLATSDDRFLFGLQRFQNGSENIYPDGSAFQFGGKIPERYLGQQAIRGIPTDAWRSCIYWDSLDATMNVTWYFSAANKWITSSNTSVVPVRCHVTGRRYTSQTAYHDFDHVYDFTYYKPRIDEGHIIWELPPSTVCPGRRNSKPFPTQPQYFKMKSEIVIPKTNFVSFIWEWYDFTTKVSRFQYRPIQFSSQSTTNFMLSQYGTNFLTEIHDYNTGLAFVMDNVRGNCSVHPITLGTDAVMVDPHHIRMVSVHDYINYIDPGTLGYSGVKTVRGISSDVWVATLSNLPGLGPNTTWEWYYAHKNWLRDHGFPNNTVLPVMFNMNAPSLDYYTIFNVYDYDEDEPSLLNFDTTPCFGPSQKKDVKFILPAQYKKYVSDELSMFRYFVMVTVAGYTTISPTRINNIKIDYLDNKDLLISLRMLDVPPVPGDIVNPQYQMPLQDAVDILTFGINTGNFTIDINGVSMRARPYSVTSKDTVIEEHPWKNIKLEYTGGSVVGLGVAMLLISFILGFIIFMIIKKKRARS